MTHPDETVPGRESVRSESGGSAVTATTSVGALGFAAGPPQGETAPVGGSAVTAVTSVGAVSLDAEALYKTLLRGVQQMVLLQQQPRQLVGITSGGAWLAQRLHADLGWAGKAGVISSSLHRDDFARRGMATSAQTQLPFDVNGAHVLLVDDVLHTGRTVRAVVNELFDYGRPASVTLVVLVDRGGRELPVEATLAAARVSLPASQKLDLARADDGHLSLVVGAHSRAA